MRVLWILTTFFLFNVSSFSANSNPLAMSGSLTYASFYTGYPGVLAGNLYRPNYSSLLPPNSNVNLATYVTIDNLTTGQNVMNHQWNYAHILIGTGEWVVYIPWNSLYPKIRRGDNLSVCVNFQTIIQYPDGHTEVYDATTGSCRLPIRVYLGMVIDDGDCHRPDCDPPAEKIKMNGLEIFEQWQSTLGLNSDPSDPRFIDRDLFQAAYKAYRLLGPFVERHDVENLAGSDLDDAWYAEDFAVLFFERFLDAMREMRKIPPDLLKNQLTVLAGLEP